MKRIPRKIEKFFDFHMGWFFVNGRKEEYYYESINKKWKQIESEEEKYINYGARIVTGKPSHKIGRAHV